MAKPRIFVSSTYYDLKHIRNTLEAFIDSFGYDAILFESGDIPFHHDQPLDESCYGEIQNCHMLILIVGGRYGSPTSDSKRPIGKELEKAYEKFNSVTKKEYETARERDIPIFIFVEKGVLAEYQTYKDNRDNKTIKFVHVDSVNVYRLLDDILAQRRNNFVREFEKFDDISNWLRDQWAGLFADFLSRKKNETTLNDLTSQVAQLRSVSTTLKEYTESIMREIKPEDYENIIDTQSKKLRATNIVLFSENPLINHLLSHIPESKAPLLYSAFEKSTSLLDFFIKAKCPKSAIDYLIPEYTDVVNNDYNKLRQRFIEGKDIDIT